MVPFLYVVNSKHATHCLWQFGHNLQFAEPLSFCFLQSVNTWSSDIHFGAQRLIGCNPLMIKLCNQLPEK